MSVSAEEMVVMQEQLAKGNLVGEEAEAAQKALDEATAAAEEAKKAEEEEAAKIAKDKMTDEEKAEAEKKEAEAKAAEEAEAAKKKEEEDKAAYEKLSDEEKAEADKKAAEEKEAAEQAERDERNKNIKIPKFRLDAATARARKAEEERDGLALKLAEAEKAKKDDKDDLTLAQQHDKELEDIDAKIAEAMKEGDSATVSKLMTESRNLERGYQSDVAAINLKKSSESTTAQVNETALVNSILDQLEKQYPMFDENSDDYNADANADVLRIQKGLIATGDSAADALVEAVNMVLPKYGFTDEEKKDDDDKSEAEKKAAVEKAAKDKAEQVKKNLDTAGKQPPNMDDAGDDSDSAGANSDLPNVLDLTDEEYNALPESKLKEMRGDNF